MSGRTFTYLSSYDDFVRQLLPDVELPRRRKSVGIGDNMLREVEEFINRFCVTATNDAGDLTFDAAGTYTFAGAVILKGDNAAISSSNYVPGTEGGQSQSGFKLDGTTGTGDFASGLIVDGAVTLGSGSTSAPSIGFFGDTNTGVFRPSDEVIGFVTGGTQRATITSTGVGIGLASPSAKLHIVDTGEAIRMERSSYDTSSKPATTTARMRLTSVSERCLTLAVPTLLSARATPMAVASRTRRCS